MTEATKGGYVVLKSVNVPDTVEPGESFQAEARVRNDAAVVGPFDPDLCGRTRPGYRLEVVFRGPDGSEVVKSDCMDMASHNRYTATLQAPSSGRAQVAVFVRLPGSGKATDEIDASAAVSSTPPEQPDEPDSGPSLPDFGNDPDGNGPDVGGSVRWVALALIAVAVAWAVDSGGEVIA